MLRAANRWRSPAAMNRNDGLRRQCERQVANKEGVNYAQARACYGREVADAIFHELLGEDCDRAYVTRREHDRLVEWKGSGDRRANGIVRNIVEGTLEDEVA